MVNRLVKKCLGIRVMSLEGGQPTVSQYLVRWATRFFEWPLVFSMCCLVLVFFQLFFVVFLVFSWWLLLLLQNQISD